MDFEAYKVLYKVKWAGIVPESLDFVCLFMPKSLYCVDYNWFIIYLFNYLIAAIKLNSAVSQVVLSWTRFNSAHR